MDHTVATMTSDHIMQQWPLIPRVPFISSLAVIPLVTVLKSMPVVTREEHAFPVMLSKVEKRTHYLGDLDVDERMLLKCI